MVAVHLELVVAVQKLVGRVGGRWKCVESLRCIFPQGRDLVGSVEKAGGGSGGVSGGRC